MANLRHITIDWTYPRLLSEYNSHPSKEEFGVYYISRCIYYADHIDETPIYIGKTRQTFKDRIYQHFYDDKEFLHKRGELYVRFGRIVKPENLSSYGCSDYDFDRLLLTIESGIIYELQELGCKVSRNLTNIQQKCTYTRWFDLEIENIGYRGLVPSKILNRNHVANEFYY